ncbi:MAG: hypothetical protein HY835_04260, partial [Anaerolineae bacterium]|nr:hypothetical protein [Anaerolineae bacterium]
FQRALRYRQEQEDPAPIRIARWCVARTLRSLNRLEEALQIQQELLAENTEDGYISEELGELYLALGKPEEARPHFAQAYSLLSKDDWLVKNEAQRLERIRSLG